MPRTIEIPAKLQHDLRKAPASLRDAFADLCSAIAVTCPNATLRARQRYSAFYVLGKIFAYVEPQVDKIAFGLFRADANAALVDVSLRGGHFPDWNRSKGGLTGYWLQAVDANDLRHEVAAIANLLAVAYGRANDRVYDE